MISKAISAGLDIQGGRDQAVFKFKAMLSGHLLTSYSCHRATSMCIRAILLAQTHMCRLNEAYQKTRLS